jgi:hypothetical protein
MKDFSKIKYLKGIPTLDLLKKQYYKWALELHPDRGGSVEEMQILNAEYEFLTHEIMRGVDFSEYQTKQEVTFSEHFADILNHIINLQGVVIEIIGTWVWVTGNTYPHRATMNGAGFKFSGKKTAWYWHSGEYRKLSKKRFSLEDLREMFGSQSVETKMEPALN